MYSLGLVSSKSESKPESIPFWEGENSSVQIYRQTAGMKQSMRHLFWCRTARGSQVRGWEAQAFTHADAFSPQHCSEPNDTYGGCLIAPLGGAGAGLEFAQKKNHLVNINYTNIFQLLFFNFRAITAPELRPELA